jgi:peptidoglycan/xylan/chitin deacetylase (PgdA/CDA1 family)
MTRPLALPTFPGGAAVAVSLTFDVDAESGWLGYSEEHRRRLAPLSEGRFGIVRGLPRILELLDERRIPATFYVPGDTAQRHTEAVREIVAAGHEIGHHGHRHLSSDRVDRETQRAELQLGFEALGDLLGVKPTGYRSPGCRITPETFELLGELGFAYDSSLMEDDRPYLAELNGTSIVEIPMHWSLDDWPHFGWGLDSGAAGPADQSALLNVWVAEFETALAEGQHVTYTMHPEVIGRRYRMATLRRFLEEITSRADVWFVSHGDLARAITTPEETT